MGGYQVKPELLEAVKKEVTATNLQLLKSLQGKEDIFNTTAYVSKSAGCYFRRRYSL